MYEFLSENFKSYASLVTVSSFQFSFERETLNAIRWLAMFNFITVRKLPI